MSRLAKAPIAIPANVTLEVNGQEVKTKGPKGELTLVVHNDVSVDILDGEAGKEIKVAPRNDNQQARALWGTMWSRIKNDIHGVTEGFVKELEIHGVGYRANLQGRDLVIALGFSHEVRYTLPDGIDVAIEKQTALAVSGIDKQKVGQVAAEIRSFRPPEPFKGKGVRYKDEYIHRKEGKKK